MRELTSLLETIVQQVRFAVGQQSNVGELSQVTWITPPTDTMTSEEIRRLVKEMKWDNEEQLRIVSDKPIVPEELFAELRTKLSDLLHCHMRPDGDHIGHVVPTTANAPGIFHTIQENSLICRAWESSVDETAKMVIRGAAVLGPKRVVQLLSDWIDGKPVRYRTSALLVGVRADQPLRFPEGIWITPLPTSSDNLPNGLPRHSNTPVEQFLGRVVLSVESAVKPAFFLPTGNHERSQQPQATSVLGEKSLDQFCESLSLAYNCFVSYTKIWNDYGELSAFSFGRDVGGWWSRTTVREPTPSSLSWDFQTGTVTHIRGRTKPTLSQEHLEQAWKLFALIPPKSSIKTAVSRWVKSKQPDTDLQDKLIDLRIALEALFLSGGNTGELRFRLATQGAWYVGRDFADRKKTQNVLKEFYNKASKVVHGASLISPNAELLEEAQEICRRGIIKRLNEKVKPNWNDLILGSGME